MNKKIRTMTGILIVAALGIVLSEKFITKKPDAHLGRPLIETANVVGIDTILISKGGETLKLVNDPNNVWRLNETEGYPADALKISRLIDDLTRTDVQVLASSSKEPSSEFGLSEATTLVLQKTDKDALNLRLANNRDRGGQFIAFGDDHRVYLINQALSVDTKVSSWELKTLVNIPANQVQKIAFVAKGKKKAVLSREKPEDAIKLENIGAKEKEASSIRTNESILSALTFLERLPLDNQEFKKAMGSSSAVTVSLFDGRTYDIKIGASGEGAKRYFIFVTARPGDKTSESDAKDIETISKLMQQHAFEIPAYVATRFEKGFDDMVEKKGS